MKSTYVPLPTSLKWKGVCTSHSVFERDWLRLLTERQEHQYERVISLLAVLLVRNADPFTALVSVRLLDDFIDGQTCDLFRIDIAVPGRLFFLPVLDDLVQAIGKALVAEWDLGGLAKAGAVTDVSLELSAWPVSLELVVRPEYPLLPVKEVGREIEVASEGERSRFLVLVTACL